MMRTRQVKCSHPRDSRTPHPAPSGCRARESPGATSGDATFTSTRRAAVSVAALTLALVPTVPAAAAAAPTTPGPAAVELPAPVDVGELLAERVDQAATAVSRPAAPRTVQRPRPKAQPAAKRPPARPAAAKTGSTATATSRRTSTAPRINAPSGAAGRVVAYALAQVGDPYVWGASGPDAYDCSGLVAAAYATVGVRLPHQTGGIIRHGHPVTRDGLRPGDAVFTARGHVGIYIGGGRMVHAPQPGDHVRVAAVYAFYAGRRIV